jgi:predicted nucleic acid-binding protein
VTRVSRLLLDSSFLVAYHNSRDVHHAAAAEIMRRLMEGEWDRGLLLEYVFLEVVTVIALRLDPSTAEAVGETLLEARELEFLPCPPSFPEVWRVFRNQGQRGLSFVDAAIIAHALSDPDLAVATFDRGFEGLDGVSVVR